MNTPKHVSADVLDFLRRTDTCSVANAIETFEVRMRNEGFIHGVTRCMFPELAPVAGYAVPGRIRTTSPPIAKLCYYHRTDWWKYVASLPQPRIIVMDDADRLPGTGAFFGEIHAEIARALDCVAYISNGTVRDLGALKAARFQCFAAGTSVSHAYAHVIEFGEPVDIGGLKIAPGDLLHGDCHGVQSIPFAIADRIETAAAEITAREAELLRFCRSPHFSVEELAARLGSHDAACQPSRDH